MIIPRDLTCQTARIGSAPYRVTAIVCAVFLGFIACASEPTLREQLAAIPEKHLEFYDFDPSVRLELRIYLAPPSLVQLWKQADGMESYRRYAPTESERANLQSALLELPERFRRVLEQRLIAIYFIDDFLGSGVTDFILGADNEVYTVLILNPVVFDLSASELLTRRANSGFVQNDPEIEVRVSVSHDITGLTYILLHEAIHIVDYVERQTPYVEPSMRELFGPADRETPFTSGLWDDYRSINSDNTIPFREKLRFYGFGGGPTVSITEAESIYRALSFTGLASLYGSLSWAEDFADYLAFYHLVHIIGASYELRILQNDQSILVYSPMLSDEVMNRASMLDASLLNGAPID